MDIKRGGELVYFKVALASVFLSLTLLSLSIELSSKAIATPIPCVNASIMIITNRIVYHHTSASPALSNPTHTASPRKVIS